MGAATRTPFVLILVILFGVVSPRSSATSAHMLCAPRFLLSRVQIVDLLTCITNEGEPWFLLYTVVLKHETFSIFI